MTSLEATKGSTSFTIRSPVAVMTVFSITLFCSALLMFLDPANVREDGPAKARRFGVGVVAGAGLTQTLLLCGYGYAHLLIKGCTLRTGAVIHGAVMLMAMASLPVAIASGWDYPPEEGQAFWLLGLFAASVGLPFFAISANAPLLQSWLARSGHLQSDDPYFLYGASNAGSFVALLAYPFLIEPFVGLAPQSTMWSGGYALLVALVAVCGLMTGLASPADSREADVESASQAPTWRQRLGWIALSFVPCGLLVRYSLHCDRSRFGALHVGHTACPLSSYLRDHFPEAAVDFPRLRHKQTWGRRSSGVHDRAVAGHAILARSGPIVLRLCPYDGMSWGASPATARRRPVTEFYFLMSLGGVLGGAFASLLAPAIFDSVVEYPLLVIASFALIGIVRKESRSKGWILGLAALSIPVVLVMLWTTAVGTATSSATPHSACCCFCWWRFSFFQTSACPSFPPLIRVSHFSLGEQSAPGHEAVASASTVSSRCIRSITDAPMS